MLKHFVAGLLAAALTTGLVAPARAQETPAPIAPGPQESDQGQPAPELSPQVKAVLDKLDAAGEDLVDVRARLTYEESIPLLEQTSRSRGTLAFKKPMMIALKLGKPHREDVYTDGKVWWVVSHEDKQVQKFTVADQDSDEAPETAFLKFGFGKGAGELTREYEIALDSVQKPEDETGPTVYSLTFRPRKRKDVPMRYQAITVELTDDLWLPRRIRLEETGGEIVHVYRFSGIGRNEGIDDEAFDYTPPGSYTVVEPQKR